MITFSTWVAWAHEQKGSATDKIKKKKDCTVAAFDVIHPGAGFFFLSSTKKNAVHSSGKLSRSTD